MNLNRSTVEHQGAPGVAFGRSMSIASRLNACASTGRRPIKRLKWAWKWPSVQRLNACVHAVHSSARVLRGMARGNLLQGSSSGGGRQ